MYLEQGTGSRRPSGRTAIDQIATPDRRDFLREVLIAEDMDGARLDLPLDDAHLLVMARRGVRRIEIVDERGNVGHAVVGRSFTAIPSGRVRQVTSSGQAGHELHLFRFDDALVRRAGRSSGFPEFVGITDPRLGQLADLAMSLAETPESPPPVVWEAFAILLLNRLPASASTHAFQRGGLAPWQVRRTTEFMQANLGRGVALRELAELVGLSPFHFARAFKQSVGDPPHRYLARRRIERACELLSATNLSVIEIAAQLGYEAPGALSRMFRREIGLSPSDYRRRARSG